MTEQWQELKETITELRDNDGTATQQEVCKFLANLMDILERQMQEPRWISVSEKPKEIGCYITTTDYEEYGLSVGERFYYGKDHGWTDKHVIAWMPLPEPYKPQESESEE